MTRYSVYLLYWYSLLALHLCEKVMGEAFLPLVELHDKVLSLLALLVQKYKF
jgi:hypothetical protein